ncbi:transposase [Streptomyces xanthophaeus]
MEGRPQPAADVGGRRRVGVRLRRPARPGRHGRGPDRVVSVDSTIVRAPQHAAGARQQGPRRAGRSTMPSAGSRGGLTTEIHLAADGRCRPLAFVLTPGQAGDAPAFPQVMAAIRVGRPKGRPRTRPTTVLADEGYSSRAIREHLRKRKIRAVVPQPDDQIAHRKRLIRLFTGYRIGGQVMRVAGLPALSPTGTSAGSVGCCVVRGGG